MRLPFGSGNGEITLAERVETEKSTSSSGEEKKVKEQVDISHAVTELDHIRQAHQWDPNLPKEKLDFLNQAFLDGDTAEKVEAYELFTENSPYAEVRAAVRNYDGGEVANTVRAWILGMIFVTLGSGLNMFLSLRLVFVPSAFCGVVDRDK